MFIVSYVKSEEERMKFNKDTDLKRQTRLTDQQKENLTTLSRGAQITVLCIHHPQWSPHILVARI